MLQGELGDLTGFTARNFYLLNIETPFALVIRKKTKLNSAMSYAYEFGKI